MKKNTIKHYLKNKDIEKMGKEFIDSIREAEEYFDFMSRKMGEIRSKYEIDYIIDDLKRNKIKMISTSFLQKRYKIGYAKTARYIDILEENNLIKKTSNNSLSWVFKNK